MDAYSQYVLDKIGITRYVLRATPASDDNALQKKTVEAVKANNNEAINKSASVPNHQKPNPITRPAPSQAAPTPTPIPAPAIKPSVATPLDLSHCQDMAMLNHEIQKCTRCPLYADRKQAVIGMGDPQPEWLVVGEAPGAEEDAQGLPFVGPSGKLLDSALSSINLVRGQKVYIANAVKCRPHANKTPSIDEVAACMPFLERQIELLKPSIIMAVGRIATMSLIKDEKTPLGKLRLKRFDYPVQVSKNTAAKTIPVVVTYHPAYLIRNLTEKAKTWQDMVFAAKVFMETKKNSS